MAGKVMPWLKLFTEARTDKKLAILSLAERGVWVNLLCYASEQETRGTFDASDRYDLALECADGDEDVLNSALEKLLKIKHLVRADSEGYMTFRTFEARQARKPSDEPEATRERQRRSRARHASSPDVTPTSRRVTRDSVTKANVTRLERDRERDPISGSDLNGEEDPTSLRGAHAPTRVDPLFDALFAEFYAPGTPLTASARGALNSARRQIADAGGTPEQVRTRGAEYQARMPHVAYTPSALAKHWPTLDRKGQRPNVNGATPAPPDVRGSTMRDLPASLKG